MRNFRPEDMPKGASINMLDADADAERTPEAIMTPVHDEPVDDIRPDDDSDDDLKVPSGSAAEVLAWVDGDKERAQLAYGHEQESANPRKGLSAELQEITGA